VGEEILIGNLRVVCGDQGYSVVGMPYTIKIFLIIFIKDATSIIMVRFRS